MNKFKFFVLISVFCLMIMIPTSFAADGETAVAIDGAVDNLTLASDGSDVLTSDWYFDSNAENDNGNGSITSPYKTLKKERINSNSILHLANGNYAFNGYTSINNVTIIGDDPLQTILSYSSGEFSCSSSLTLKNLTLINIRIIESNFSASNVIFKDYSRYSTSNGAVIQSNNNSINLDNCTFSNNYAKYGGAIYLNNGNLTVTDSLFINNKANLYGGAIVGIGSADIHINNSRFLDSYSINDAGGAIYLFNSNLMAYNLEINNCSSTFGGAITSLKSTLNLNNFTGKNNKAKYDGGAIYAMYRSFNMDSSLLQNNTAENAGAVYVYNVDDFLISNTRFTENHAGNCASAFYSVFLQDPYYDSILDSALNNTFSNNNPCENDVLEAILPDISIGSNDYTLYKTDFSENYTIPSSYDLRDLGLVSSVKNQGSDGNCWAFATLGALESSILKATGIEFDLSEQNMKNLISLYSAYGWNKIETNEGGYSRMGLGYLTSWLGPINESDDEYKLDTALSTVLNSIMHVQNILFLKRDNYTDNDEIKLAVMKYGGVASSMGYYSGYNKGKSYYYDGNRGTNHLVVIVGWDDNYSKSNFKNTPPGDGAWIIKNSWGTYQGENGYFYVSYYDNEFAKGNDYDPFVFVLNDTIKYDKNYQYDIPGMTDYFLIQTNELWYKNKFTATDNEYLAAVSTYFIKETAWELSVYVNNALKLTQSGSAVPSYKTIDLNQLIKLNKGDVFEIVFKVDVENEACLPISEFVSLNTEFYSRGMSYISYDGNTWKDLYNLTWAYSSHTYASQVACIKAFTVLNAIGTSVELDVSNNDPALIKAIVKDQYGNLIKSGSVTFNIEGENIVVDVVNGIASLTYIFDTLGEKSISAMFSGTTGFVSSSISKTFVIGKILTNISAVHNKVSGELVATLINDVTGKGISGANVVVTLNGETYTLKTNSKGQVKVSTADLAFGVYTATVSYKGNSKYNPSNATVVVNTKLDTCISAVYDKVSGELVATLTNVATAKGISGANVVVTLNGETYTLKTNGKGQAVLSVVDLAPGVYTAAVSYKGNSKYNPSNTTVVVNIKSDTCISVVYDKVSGELVATLINVATGKAIVSANVVVSLNDETYSLKTNGKGQAVLSVVDLAPGVYTAAVSYKGNSKYNPSNTTVVVNTKLDTCISVVYDGESDELVATLINVATGKAIVSANVVVSLNGETYTLKTNSKGQVKVSTADLAFGVYSVTVSYKGNSKYNPSNVSAVVNTRLDTCISVVYDGESDQFIATLTNAATGKGIVSANVVVSLNGETYTLKTNSKGQVSLSTSDLATGVNTVTVSYNGNSKYNPSNASVVVNIKSDTCISAVYDDDSNQFIATLTNAATGKGIVSANVVVRLGGKIYLLKTNSNGQVSVSTADLAPGVYTVIVSYNGNSNYNSSTATVFVNI